MVAKLKGQPKPQRRRVVLPEPSEGLRPWMHGFKQVNTITDCLWPFFSDGWIDRNGNFFATDPGTHAMWARELGCTEGYLIDEAGWVAVWSYKSMFNKMGDDPVFRFSFRVFPKLSNEQKRTMMDWCQAKKMDLKRAMGYFWDMFQQ